MCRWPKGRREVCPKGLSKSSLWQKHSWFLVREVSTNFKMTEHIRADELQLTYKVITCVLPARQVFFFYNWRVWITIWWVFFFLKAGTCGGEVQMEKDKVKGIQKKKKRKGTAWMNSPPCAHGIFWSTPLLCAWHLRGNPFVKRTTKGSVGFGFNHPGAFFWVYFHFHLPQHPFSLHADLLIVGLRAYEYPSQCSPLQLPSPSALSNVTSQQDSWQTQRHVTTHENMKTGTEASQNKCYCGNAHIFGKIKARFHCNTGWLLLFFFFTQCEQQDKISIRRTGKIWTSLNMFSTSSKLASAQKARLNPKVSNGSWITDHFIIGMTSRLHCSVSWRALCGCGQWAGPSTLRGTAM